MGLGYDDIKTPAGGYSLSRQEEIYTSGAGRPPLDERGLEKAGEARPLGLGGRQANSGERVLL